MSLCCPVSVKRHHEGPALVIVIFCRLVLAFGANRFRGEKYHSFSVVMLYSHVFPADLTVTYTVWFNFVLELPYIVKLRVNVGQISQNDEGVSGDKTRDFSHWYFVDLLL